MAENTKLYRVGIEGVSYSLAHMPELVRFGSKPLRELRANPALAADLTRLLRDFAAALVRKAHRRGDSAAAARPKLNYWRRVISIR